jgi:hypothetical protein
MVPLPRQWVAEIRPTESTFVPLYLPTLLKRSAHARHRLAQERAALAERQRQERQNRPEDVTAEEPQTRHKAARQALEEKARRASPYFSALRRVLPPHAKGACKHSSRGVSVSDIFNAPARSIRRRCLGAMRQSLACLPQGPSQ